MANKQKKQAKRSTTPSRTVTDQLNVRMPTELFRRVSAVAGAMGQTLVKFVSDTLDERTKEHKTDVQRIADRERLLKK